MRRWRGSFGLPLLARELTEQAKHARHYALRSLCAAVLFFFGFLYLQQLLDEGGVRSFASLGHGGALFERIYRFEVIGVLIFVPAMTCGAIAGEKERNTLSILLTTRLGATTIILEKLLSRLVPAFALLLLSVPLLTVGYALGGLTVETMTTRIVELASLTLFAGTLSLACSTWCGDVVSAFFMTYAIGLGFVVLASVFRAPLHLYSQSLTEHFGLTLSLSVVFFCLSVVSLVRRAFVAPRNFVLGAFRSLDRLYVWMNQAFGNIVLTRETNTLPDAEPVAWRETAKKSLGTVRYRVRILVAIEFPTLFVLVVMSQSMSNTGPVRLMWVILWCVSAILIAVMCGGLVSGERARQTLPVLLSTPIPGREIVLQFFAGVRRLIAVTWIPLATVMAFQCWYFQNLWLPGELPVSFQLLFEFLQVTIYAYLIAWVSFWVGAKVRTPTRAIVASLSLVSVAVLLPALCQGILNLEWPSLLLLGSPATITGGNSPGFGVWRGMRNVPGEMNDAGRAYRMFWIVMGNFAVYGSLLVLVRGLCLRRADRLLGRAEMNHSRQSLPEAPIAVSEEVAAV